MVHAQISSYINANKLLSNRQHGFKNYITVTNLDEYMLFTNDLVEVFSFAKVKIYTNDLTIYANIKCDNDRQTFQHDLINSVNGALSENYSH